MSTATRSELVTVDKFSSGARLHLFQPFAEHMPEASRNNAESSDPHSLFDYACCYRKTAAQFCAGCTRVFGFRTGKGAGHRPVGLGADFDELNAWYRGPQLDPSEIAFMSLNTGLASDMGVMAITLEATGRTRKPRSQGELQ
ncbi:hypothetical protein [Hoeflea sp.]|uniref:hypothetical protein n=1 Tax=Hoeflea sp. TaxID=1940281 RepID=UPI001988345F|nr:hypothetical protein [Hoeflea sp.]MBC7281626.1 hypothetical protein [Hoeflea sp.]